MEKLTEIIVTYPFLVIGAFLIILGAIGVLPLGKNRNAPIYPIRRPWRLTLLVVGLAAIVYDAFRSQPKTSEQSLSKVTGDINQPDGRAPIARTFTASGWAEDLESGHLWLIVEIGTHKWPKGDELQLDTHGRWQREVQEDGTGPTWSLALYVADQIGHAKIREWLDIGTLIGYHPFEREIPGTRRLKRVDDLHM